jgi:hypothetical protein
MRTYIIIIIIIIIISSMSLHRLSKLQPALHHTPFPTLCSHVRQQYLSCRRRRRFLEILLHF